MKEKHIQLLGIFLTVVYAGFVAWLYLNEPKNLRDFGAKAQTTVESVTTKTQVLTGSYEIDKAMFDEGLRNFRGENFVAARDFFRRADPERRDARTQFYIAYSFYRQGFGQVSNDDELFKKGLEQADFVAQLDKNFKSDDADLQLKTVAELKNEFEEGLKVTASDFNPLRVFRQRK